MAVVVSPPPEVQESILVKKTSETRILFEFKYFYGAQATGEIQARMAVAQIHDIISANPQTQFEILVRLAPQSEITTALDANRAYLDIMLHKQVRKIAVVFDAEKHSKSVTFVVNVFQKLTDKIKIFTEEREAVAWLDLP